jgi:hypothetical protein
LNQLCRSCCRLVAGHSRHHLLQYAWRDACFRLECAPATRRQHRLPDLS